MMIAVVVIAVLVWLLIVNCLLRVSHLKRRRLIGEILDKYADVEKPVASLRYVESDLLILSGRADMNVTHANHAIFISAVCVGAPILLAVLNHTSGVHPAGWMSVLFLPAPACMLGWHIRDWFRLHAVGQQFDTVRGLAASVRQQVSMDSIVLVMPVLLAVQAVTQGMAGREVQSVDMAGPVASIGIFAVISGLIVIIAGGIALRLLYINKEYRERAGAVGRSGQTSRRDGGRPTGESAGDVHGTGGGSLSETHKELANIGSKREANGRGILVDGICMITICVVGFGTALDYSPSLLVSTVVASACLLCAVVPLHYHIRNALNLHESYPL